MVTTQNAARNKFIKNFGESSESEEEQRVVKTGQDKKREHLYADARNCFSSKSMLRKFEELFRRGYLGWPGCDEGPATEALMLQSWLTDKGRHVLELHGMDV